MTKSIDFIFDFASPNSYLTHQVVPQIEQRTGAKFNYRLCLLGGIFKQTGNQAPMTAFAGIRGKLEYDRIETERFMKKHAIGKFRANPHFPVNTLLMMRGAVVAEQDGLLSDYIEAGLRFMWEEGLKMDDPAVFVSAMNGAGFDGAALLKRTGEPAVKAQLIENTTAAVARGAFGIPTYFVGDEIFFGKERLPQVEQAVTAGR